MQRRGLLASLRLLLRECELHRQILHLGGRLRAQSFLAGRGGGLLRGSARLERLLIGGSTALLFSNPLLGGVIAAAMVINNLTAGLAGILVPVTLDRLKIDPAVSSAVFVTTATDVMGFFSFLGLAVISGLAG